MRVFFAILLVTCLACSSALAKSAGSNGHNGRTHASDKSQGKGLYRRQSEDDAVGLDQDEAIDAVRHRDALPLRTIIRLAEADDIGHVVDAELMWVDGALVYQLTVVTDQGMARRAYYEARSGFFLRFV